MTPNPSIAPPGQASAPATRFWIGTGIFIALLAAAVVAVALIGGTPTLRARRLLPENNSTVSVNPAIQVVFANPVDKSSVENAITTSPPFSYTLSWEENTLNLRPQLPLTANAAYTIQVGPGIQVSDGTAMEGELKWSFKTRQPRIAFMKITADNISELWMTNGDGSDPRRLSSPSQTVQNYAVAPDGSSLIFTVEEGGTAVNLWRVDDGNYGLHRLTEDDRVLYGSPAFSPGGELLAVEVRRITQVGEVEQQSPPHVELRQSATGIPAGNVYGGEGNMAHSPRWSADGTRLAFFEPNQGTIGIYDFTIGEVRFFAGSNAMLGHQAWSPDNRALVYTSVEVSEHGDAQQQILYRDVDLGTVLYLGEDIGDQADAAWHPSGELIAYAYKAPPGLEAGNGIWTMSPVGEGRLPLVTSATIGASSEAFFSYPIWSPDGEWLLFTVFDPALPNTGQSIWIIRRNGTDPMLVTNDGYQPFWVP